jgi:hypothetical protein
MENPELFKSGNWRSLASPDDEAAFVHEALRAAQVERLYEPLFSEPA